MVTNNTIKKHLQSSAPQPKKSEEFMADTIRQINLMPSPSSELQETLRKYTLMDRLVLRMDAARWLILGGSGSVAFGYVVFTHFDAIVTTIITWCSLF